MAEHATQATWLSGRPQRTLIIRPPPTLPSSYTEYREWSFRDHQIMLALPPPTGNHDGRVSASTIYLADIQDGLSSEDGIIEFKLIATLPFYAIRATLLSDRAGFVTAEFCAALRDYAKPILAIEDEDNESDLVLRAHNCKGEVTKTTTILAAAVGASIAVRGSSVAICVGVKPNLLIDECDVGPLNQIVTWNVDSGDMTRTEIPQDERAPLVHTGNFQFAGPSHIALGGCIDASYDERCAALKSFSTTSPGEPVRYFCQDENIEVDDDYDALAIPGSSVDNDFIIHHHQRRSRFTVLNAGSLTGEIPSDPVSTPSYYDDRDYHEGLFRTFSDHDDRRILRGAPCDVLPSLVENRLLVRESYDEYNHDKQQYHVFASSGSSFDVLYLYDFDQSRCNTLRQLTLAQRQQLETRLREQNVDARVTVVSRRYFASTEKEECYYEQIQFPGWAAYNRKLWEVRGAREKGQAKFPLLEFDDTPKGQNEDGQILFTRSMVCLPRMREDGKVALTPSAIVYLPEGKADGYACKDSINV